ncbi:hypothetical protein GmHk_04G010590 [Glycine max]|nr:hypothetical protein GmHk_04G010590 [Glycine max]KAH1254069.1 hypothetical protein GmHk_04G010590 [Glycine max]KAH1254073.1 hypothetical protein GmHk_04G010590 [Glycine max]
MDEDEWMYEIMSEQEDNDYENEEACGANEPHVDCSDAFNTSQSMVKPRNILLTLKEHNANSCTTIKQIYNARSAFRSSIRGSDLEMQHLMKLLERDQYIHWHRIKDEDMQFDECLKKFEMACAPWPMFVDYVKETWIIPHKEKFVSAWTNKVMHLENTTTNKRLLGMISRYALNHIAAELERVDYAGKNHSSCGCVRRLSFSDQGLSEPEVSIKEVMETISKRFKELDVCGKFTLKTKLWEIACPDQNSMCPPPAKVNTKGAPKKAMSRNPRSTKRDPS